MIFDTEGPTDFTQKLLELINDFNKLVGYKINIQKSAAFLYANNGISESKKAMLGSIPGSGRSPGEGNGKSLWYSCLENPTDGEVWEATAHGAAKCPTGLRDFTFTFTFL